MAIEIDPNNFLAHYNRGLLRVQVGDDNRAIDDFDFILQMEPGNLMATYNRAVLHHKTGNLKAAIVDYTTVINQYPNFWVGLKNRAECYRRLGMINQAEMDEFRIFKAQMDKHIGIQPRWTAAQRRATRKKSEIDMNKYNQIVVADEETVEHEFKYDSPYRGRVQDREVGTEYQPMYLLAYTKYNNVVKSYLAFDSAIDAYNQKYKPLHTLYLTCNPSQLDENTSKSYFMLVDTLSARIDVSRDMVETENLLMQRAVAHTALQNLDDAVADLNTLLSIDSICMVAYWQRGVCLSMMIPVVAQGMDIGLMQQRVIDNFTQALTLAPQNAYLYYNRANVYAARGDYQKAIDDYDKAIECNASLPEAFFNRGLSYANVGDKQQAVKDFSTAGQLGVYGAYNLIKQYSK
jgi:tetratricopeptide (TPR) repeat protein